MDKQLAPYKDAADKAVAFFGTHLAIAKALGYGDLRNVSAWATGLRPFPAQHCVTLERESLGAVTCEELRPGEPWRRIPDKSWPHPKGRPVLDFATALADAKPLTTEGA